MKACLKVLTAVSLLVFSLPLAAQQGTTAAQAPKEDTSYIVFEGLPHAFWNDVSLPESREAYRYMAGFFTKHLRVSAGSGGGS